MQDQPLVSIIIPTFNRAHLIGETLDSVLAQTYQNWECIVVDDGSTDGTEELLDEYVAKDARFQYYHRPDDRLPGGNAARNYGFEVSKGEYVNWLDSDDLFDCKKIEKQIDNLILSKCEVSICLGEFFNSVPKDNLGNVWCKYTEPITSVFEALITQKVRWPCGAVLWSRSVLKSSFWDEGLKGGQEWLFHIQQALKLNDSDFRFIQEVMCYIRNNNLSITNNGSLVNRYSNYLKARIILLNYLSLNDPERFKVYFHCTYQFSIKYVRELIKGNRYRILFTLSKLIFKISIIKYIKFWVGVIVYKVFKKDFILKYLTKG